MKQIVVENKPSQRVRNVKKSLFVHFQYDMETVGRIKKLPKRYYNPKTKEWEVPTRYLSQLITTFQDYNMILKGPVDTKVEQAVSKVARFDKVDASGYEFKTEPFPHQREGFWYGIDHNKFLLGDEQGLGKTKQTIDIAVARKSQFKHCLIVCGVNSLKYNWLDEIHTHSNEDGRVLGSRIITKGKNKGDLKDGGIKERLKDLEGGRKEFFLITNIETMRNKDFQKKVEEMTISGEIGMVVIDEIHKAKNGQSQQGKAIHKLKSFYKMGLTGTALMNSPLDLYNPLKWLDEEQGSFTAFRNRYCVMGGYGGYEVIDYKNLEELRIRLHNIMLRRKKDEVLDLPPKMRQTVYVEMEGKQKKLYQDIREQIISNIDEIALNPNPLAQLIRLRQVTGHPAILDQSIKESAKMERLKDYIDEIASSGKKAIVFSEWEMMTRAAKEVLEEYNPAYAAGDGDVEKAKKKFKEDDTCSVIIGTRGKLGTGHTLTEASYVIFLDKPWNQANMEQAEDRAHRIGTTGTLNVITLVAKNSIDERIEEIVYKKGEMSKALVDGEYGDLDKMDKKELLELLLY